MTLLSVDSSAVTGALSLYLLCIWMLASLTQSSQLCYTVDLTRYWHLFKNEQIYKEIINI